MKKITNGKIFALCLGDFARGLINGIITTYLLTFFIPTNSNTTLPQFFMKAALTMAIIRGIGTVIDAVTDPWVASLSDNSKAKSGRRISFMRWSAIPYGLFCLLIFFPPVAGSSVINAIWVGVMLALYYLFSTLYNIPYSALQAEVVAEPRKRVFLYSIVSLLYVVSSAMVFCTSMIKSILMKNGIEEIWALRIPFIVFCVLGGIAALIPAFVIKEKDYVEPKEYHQSIWDALKATVSYPNFAIITVGYLIMWIAFTFFNTAEVYYITNLLNLGDGECVGSGVACGERDHARHACCLEHLSDSGGLERRYFIGKTVFHIFLLPFRRRIISIYNLYNLKLYHTLTRL